MSACNSDPIAKPRGYFRIEIPAVEYTSYHHPCGPTFDVPVYAKVERIPTDARNDDCWFNLAYPMFSAKLHCTMVRFEGNPAFYALIDDVHEMVFSHESKSTGIQSHTLHFQISFSFFVSFFVSGHKILVFYRTTIIHTTYPQLNYPKQHEVRYSIHHHY
jgi:hypothetical protein